MNKSKGNIFLIGPMGAGKTSVGRHLAEHLHKTFYDSDQEIEKRMGVNLTWIYDIEGMEGFRQRELKVIEELSALDNVVLATGGGCIEESAIRECLFKRGVVIYLEVGLSTQLSRLKRDKRRPQLQGNDSAQVLTRLWEEREPIYEQIADLTVITDKRSVYEVVRDILVWLEIEDPS